MAVKKILKYGDVTLRKKSKEVHKVSKKVQILIEDLLDTMYSQNGVGLAAPQIGENLRIFVIDTSTDKEPCRPMVFINPKFIKKEGAMNSTEGCLSFPEVYTDVRRYKSVMVKALDSKGRPFVLEASDDTLLVKAIQHEYDHLEGILFIDHVRNRFEADKLLMEKGFSPIDTEFLIDETELENKISDAGDQEKE